MLARRGGGALSESERDPQFTWKSCSAERKAAFQEAKDQVLDGGLTAPAHPSQWGGVQIHAAGLHRNAGPVRRLPGEAWIFGAHARLLA